MGADIIEAVESKLGNATDNLYRARVAFSGCTEAQMQQQYGQSGSTRAQILDEYTQEVARWEAALATAKRETP